MHTSLPKKTKLVPISEAAKVLGVSIDTIRRWDKKGILHSERVDGKNRYFAIDELEKVKFTQPLPISEAAKRLKISPSTLRRIEKQGLITPERNEAGERVYDQESLEKFLNSEYFLRQKGIEETILEPLQDSALGTEESLSQKAETAIAETKHRLLGVAQEQIRQEVSRLVILKRFVFTSSLFLMTLFTALLIIITTLFLNFPEQTANFFGYLYKKSISFAPQASTTAILGVSAERITQNTTSDRVLGVALRPLSGISLGIVKYISPEIYQRIISPSTSGDINQFFSLDDSGNIVPKYNIKLPEVNTASPSAIQEIIGLKEIKSDSANLTVSTADNISTLKLDLTNSIGTTDIKNGAVSNAKLANSSITFAGDSGTSSSTS